MQISTSLLACRLLAILKHDLQEGLLVVVDGEQKAEALARLMGQLASDEAVHFFPAWDCFPYDRAAPSADIMGDRMRVLRALERRANGVAVVTTPEALLQRLPPRGCLGDTLRIGVGEKLSTEPFGVRCADLGYLHADRVDQPGQFAIRGEAIDVYPPGPKPYRLIVLDGKVTAIHAYDPQSQRSTAAVSHIGVEPVSEVVPQAGTTLERFAGMEHWLPLFHAETETLFGYLRQARVAVEAAASGRLDLLLGEIAEAYRDRVAADKNDPDTPFPAVTPEKFFLTADEWRRHVDGSGVSFPVGKAFSPVPRFSFEKQPKGTIRKYVKDRRAAGRRIVLSSPRERELPTLLRTAGDPDGKPERLAHWGDLDGAKPGSIAVMMLSADHGFDDEEGGVTLITAADMLGHHARPSSSRAVRAPWHMGEGEFAIGDLVIHIDHGVGVLKGLETIEIGSAAEQQDILRLDYAKETDLLTPVQELDRVWRYGAGDDGLSLDKLGTEAWAGRRAKIAREMAATAQRLVALAEQRNGAEAPRIVPPDREYEAFCGSFSFAPTPDQLHAIDDCLGDLSSGRPMDRLIVGDVGFGKTEIALRAAAAAVFAGWQVAIVAPTTVLVRQHVHNFAERFKPFGIEVAHVSRLVSGAEARRVKSGLADGSVKMVIGTHALASDDVRFHNLALLIVDEEQRFGTAAKGKIRDLGVGVHVMTLTATPIPRTLQSALVGLQDLSIIATPPARRRPIRTLIAPVEIATMRSALLREKGRGGQSYVVVPRIEDLEPLAASLTASLPDLTFLVGHGKMEPEAVDDAMMAFANGEADVLVATSIIESGLDVPRANTMIVAGAARFGLAQLHQLRGRVGQGRHQGVCYLMVDPKHGTSEATHSRLAALARMDRLGDGMAISAQDLDQRGAGDLLGEDQAGHARLIGLGLYRHLLQRAILEARGEPVEDWTPEIHIGDVGGLPAGYLPEPELRVNLYARIVRANDLNDIDQLEEEIGDRFGPLPEETKALLVFARLKRLCQAHDIARVDAGPKGIGFTPRPGTAAEKLIEGMTAGSREKLSVRAGRVIYDCSATARFDHIRLASDLFHQTE